MKEIIEFLTELHKNNNREWFGANKERYKRLQGIFNDYVSELIAGIALFDPSVKDVTLKQSLFRIYHDTRFSPNKNPYNTHMSAYIARGGRWGGYSGYFVNIEPVGKDYVGCNMLSAGIYCPEPKVLRSIRDEIFDNGAEFVRTIDLATGFGLLREVELKRVPQGYPADSPYADYLRLKDFSIGKEVPDSFFTSDRLVERTLAEFEKTLPFNNLLNRAVDFAMEEM